MLPFIDYLNQFLFSLKAEIGYPVAIAIFIFFVIVGGYLWKKFKRHQSRRTVVFGGMLSILSGHFIITKDIVLSLFLMGLSYVFLSFASRASTESPTKIKAYRNYEEYSTVVVSVLASSVSVIHAFYFAKNIDLSLIWIFEILAKVLVFLIFFVLNFLVYILFMGFINCFLLYPLIAYFLSVLGIAKEKK